MNTPFAVPTRWFRRRARPDFSAYVFRSSTQTHAVYKSGISTNIPLPADYDGDGRTDLAVSRPANSYWFVYDLKTG